MKKIIVNLDLGQGLGNQLWCIFSAIGIAQRSNRCVLVGNYKYYKGRNIIDFTKSVEKSLNFIEVPNKIGPRNEYDLITGLDYCQIKSSELTEYLELDADVEVLGNLQDVMLLPKDILNTFSFGFKPVDKLKNECSIHIRGGDYKKTLVWPSSEFYQTALSRLPNDPKIKKYIITDDKVFSNFLIPEISVLQNCNTEEDIFTAKFHSGSGIKEDFKAIFHSKWNIISASTFSFWPAYLGKLFYEDNKVVLAPHNWYSNRFPNNRECPPNIMKTPFDFVQFKNNDRNFQLEITAPFQLYPKLRRAVNIILRSLF